MLLRGECHHGSHPSGAATHACVGFRDFMMEESQGVDSAVGVPWEARLIRALAALASLWFRGLTSTVSAMRQYARLASDGV